MAVTVDTVMKMMDHGGRFSMSSIIVKVYRNDLRYAKASKKDPLDIS